jgi:ankyrin repeat protein
VETVKLLVEMGSNVHAQNVNEDTPLHLAESNGHEAVVRFLRKDAINKRRQHRKSTTAALVVDPAAQAATGATIAADRIVDSGRANSPKRSEVIAAFQAGQLQQGMRAKALTKSKPRRWSC